MKKSVVFLLIAIIIGMFTVVPIEAKSIDFQNSNTDVAYLAGLANPDDDFDHNCADFATTIRMGGYLIFLVKILLPLIIIVYSSKNVFSIVMSGKPEEFKKQAVSFAYSCAAAIVIFFIPTIINAIFGFVDSYNREKTSDSEICVACVFDPFSEECSKYAD